MMAATMASQTQSDTNRKGADDVTIKNGETNSDTNSNDSYTRVKSPSMGMELYQQSQLGPQTHHNPNQVQDSGGTLPPHSDTSNYSSYNSAYNDDTYRNSHEQSHQPHQSSPYAAPHHNYPNNSDMHPSGVSIASGGDPNKNKLYVQQQTNQMYLRGSFAATQRGGPQQPTHGPLSSMGPPTRVGHSNIPNASTAQGYNNAGPGPGPGPHRYPGGQNVAGPTPTLNQLLQSPNPSQRYHQQPNNYQEYMVQQQSKDPHLNQQQQPWNSMRYNQQHHPQQQQIYRNQANPMGTPDKRSPYNMPPYGTPPGQGPPPPSNNNQGSAAHCPPAQHHQRFGAPPPPPPQQRGTPTPPISGGYPPNNEPPNMYNPYDQRPLPQQQQQPYAPQHQQHPNQANNIGGYGVHQGFGSMNNNIMPPPSGYPTKPTMVGTVPQSPVGAAAAAQAAVMAAANSAANMRSPHSAMYLRQHLQQKIFSANSGPYPPHGPPGMTGMNPAQMSGGHPGTGGAGPMHGLPTNDTMNQSMNDTPVNSSYSMGQSIGPPSNDMTGGGASTSVTQSITSPLSAAASLTNSISEVRSGPQPPSILDEASQASTTSSQAEDSSDTPTPKQKPPGLSHPPTPNTLGSPGAASMSSFHDEFESVSSPSWPRTPASPVINSQAYEHSHSVKRPDGLMKIYDMSDEPERRNFLDKLISFQEERGTPISQCPTISKLPLDLYRLYVAVKERGGFVEVTRGKLWKECTQICNIASSSSAAYTLRKQYIKHMLPFECKFDRGGIDPQPLITSVENANRKKNKNVPPPEPSFQSHSSSSLDGYPPPGAYPPQNYPPQPPSQQSNPDYPNQQQPPQPPQPSHHPNAYSSLPVPPMAGPTGQHSSQGTTQSSMSNVNHNESVSVQDPFADDIQHNSGYTPRGHPPPPSSGLPPSNAPLTGPQPADYNYNYPNTPGHNAYYNSMPPQMPHPSLPPQHEQFANEYGDPFNNRQPPQSQPDPYNAPPASNSAYPPNRGVPASYYQSQMSDQNRSDNNRFEHNRPPSGDGNNTNSSMFVPQHLPQPQPPPNSAPTLQSRAQYLPLAPGGQSGGQTPAQPPTSNANYTRGGPSPISQYGTMGQQQSPYNNTGHDNYRNNEMSTFQNAIRNVSQSPLAQRLLAAKLSQPSQSGYPNQTMYGTPSASQNLTGMSQSKAIPPSGGPTPSQPPTLATLPPTNIYANSSGQYPQKRHPDFMKTEPHYPSANTGYSGSQGTFQYAPYGGPNTARQTPPGTPPSGQPMWNRDGQYRGFGPITGPQVTQNSSAPPFGNSIGLSQGRENWEHMAPRSEPGSVNNWGGNRFGPTPSGPGPAGAHDLYAGPTPYGGSHQINKISNFGPRTESNRMFSMSPNLAQQKVPPHMMGPNAMGPHTMAQMAYAHHAPQHHPFLHPKKEIIFPPDSVENSQPTFVKRRRLTPRDLNSVEAWRLLMCLKSGLLAETTWALDVLSILMYDDSTVLYFGLQHLPGLLEVLLEHYKRYLSEIFDDLFDDTEIGYEMKQKVLKESKKNLITNDVKRKKWYVNDKEESDSECEDNNDETFKFNNNLNVKTDLRIPMVNDQLVVLNSTNNYTYKSRDGKPVRVMNGKSLFTDDPDKKWDYLNNGFNVGSDHWLIGGGECTNHIQTHFESSKKFVRIVKLLKLRYKKIKRNKHQNCLSIDDNGISKINGVTSVTSNCNGHLNCKKETNFDTESERNFPVSPIKEPPENDNNNNNNSDSSVKHEEILYPKIRESDLPRYLKRKNIDDLEDESYDYDDPSVNIGEEYQDSLIRRCLCLSTLIRNLSFVPGNDIDMSKHSGLLLIMSRLMLLHHSHSLKKRNFERSVDDELFSAAPEDKEKDKETPIIDKEWWWDMLHLIRENTLVTVSNIAGQLDLSPYSEEISLPLLDGLLHWAVCPSSYAHDTLPSSSVYLLSPQRLAFESLSKLSILDSNVDLMLATPPWTRIDKLYKNLARLLSRHEDQTIREFSVVLLSNLSAADSSSARSIALTGCAIPLLISFVEQAEQSALQVANSQGINALRENPELMGTTLDMVRRSASTLRCLSRVPDNRPLFLQYQQRLLALVMSQILDQGVAGIIADVIYECSLALDQFADCVSDNDNLLTPEDATINSEEQCDDSKASNDHET